MDDLDDAILTKISHFISPMDLLTSLCYVSKRFAHVAQSNAYWRDHPLLQCSYDPSTTASSTLNTHQKQRICIFRDGIEASNLPSSLSYGSLLISHEEAVAMMRDRSRRVVCAASTTFPMAGDVDHILLSESEDITRHLPRRNPRRGWYSAPSSSDSIDTLLFATKYPLALMTKLLIKIWRSEFKPKRLMVSAYRLPLLLLTNNDDHLAGFPCSFTRRWTHTGPEQETIDGLLRGQTPVYVSPEVRDIGSSGDTVIQYDFPRVGVVANVVTLTLIGKDSVITALEAVECLGIPLYSYPRQPADVATRR